MTRPAGSRQDMSHPRTKHADALDRAFILDTVAAVSHPVLTVRQKVETLLVTSGNESNLPESLRTIPYRQQRGNSTGEQLVSLCDELFQTGPLHLIVLGTNTPHIPPAFIQEAFGRLALGVDLVLGPTDGGGHYLIGIQRPLPALFQAMVSGDDGAMLNIAAFESVQTASLPSLYKISTDADLNRLKIDLKRGVVTAPATAALLATLPPTDNR